LEYFSFKSAGLHILATRRGYIFCPESPSVGCAAQPKRGLLPLLDFLHGVVAIFEHAGVIIDAIFRDGSIKFANSLLVVFGFELKLIMTANCECVVFHRTTLCPNLQKKQVLFMTFFAQIKNKKSSSMGLLFFSLWG
jgi:hypothetical protein